MIPLPIANQPTKAASADATILGAVNVAKPCPADWNTMTGDNRARFCGTCRKNVYNLSEMTAADAAALVREREGKMCVRYYVRADGTMLTQNCPVGVAGFQRRLKRKIAAAIVGVTAAAWAATDTFRVVNGRPPLIVERIQNWVARFSSTESVDRGMQGDIGPATDATPPATPSPVPSPQKQAPTHYLMGEMTTAVPSIPPANTHPASALKAEPAAHTVK